MGQYWAGTIIDGKYRIERVLGRGGMGLVVAARHMRLGHLVAIKFPIRQDLLTSDVVERLLREARAVMRLKSDHVARVIDVGVHEQAGPYLVMEYLSGQDLGALVRSKPLPVVRAIEYVLQACEALAEAHAKGIIHRDLKPSNMLLTERADGTPWLKVIDFGLAKSLDGDDGGSLTRSGAMLGSPWFTAPEQMRGASAVDARADIWALGATLYMLVTGRPPFAGKNVLDVYDSIRAGRAPLEDGSDAVRALDAVISRCLELSPGARHATVTDLAEQLVAAAPELGLDRARAVWRIAESASADRADEGENHTMTSANASSTMPPQEPSWLEDHGNHSATAEGSLALSRSVRSAGTRVGFRFTMALVGAAGIGGTGVVLTELCGPIFAPSPEVASKVRQPTVSTFPIATEAAPASASTESTPGSSSVPSASTRIPSATRKAPPPRVASAAASLALPPPPDPLGDPD
jgi:eukaryotic-like serine/threonine-protein kinase